MKDFDWIISQIIDTQTPVRDLIKESDMNNKSFFEVLKDTQFSEQYARAMQIRVEMMADEIIQISDDSSNDLLLTEFGEKENKEFVNRSRLRVDTRKWLLSKMLPKKYGDNLEFYEKLKIDQEKEQQGDNKIIIERV